MSADNVQRPPPSSTGVPTIVRDIRRLRRFGILAAIVVAAPVVLSVVGLSLAFVAPQTGLGGGLLAFVATLASAFVGLTSFALPVAILAIVAAGLAVGVAKRLQQGERTDFDVARAQGGADPARGGALAAELREDRDVALILERLETRRRAVAATVARRRALIVPLSAVLGSALAYKTYYGVDRGSALFWATIVMMFSLAIGLMLAERTKAGRDYRAAFKRELTPLLLRRFGALSIRPGVVDDLGSLAFGANILPTIDPQMCQIEDSISGMYRDRPVRIDEYRVFRRNHNGQPDRSAFAASGLLITTTSQRPWPGRLVVADGLGVVAPPSAAFARVHLEDSAFETVYRTYASDQILARAILTPRAMQAMLGVADGARLAPPLLSIDGDSVALYIAFPSAARAFLEADAMSARAFDQIALDLEDLAQIFAILDMLFDTQRLNMIAPEAGGTTP